MKTRRRPYTAQLQRVTSTLFGWGPTGRDTDEREYSGLSDARMLEVLCDLGSPMNHTWVNEDEECGDGHVDTPARVALDSGNIDGLAFLLGPKHRGIWIRNDKRRELDYDVDLAKTIYSWLPCRMAQ